MDSEEMMASPAVTHGGHRSYGGELMEHTEQQKEDGEEQNKEIRFNASNQSSNKSTKRTALKERKATPYRSRSGGSTNHGGSEKDDRIKRSSTRAAKERAKKLVNDLQKVEKSQLKKSKGKEQEKFKLTSDGRVMTVQFNRPLVTQVQRRPRTAPDEIEKLFFQEQELQDFAHDRETTERFAGVEVAYQRPGELLLLLRAGASTSEEDDDEQSSAAPFDEPLPSEI